MAAENILKLKKQAVKLGMARDTAMKAERKELEDFIAGTKAPEKKAPAKKAVVAKKKAVVKKATGRKQVRKTPTATRSAAKKTAAKRAPAKANSNGDSGRVAIGEIDWTVESDDWNPREGSAVQRLFKALKRAKGNVDKAYDALEADMYDFVGKTMRDGTRRDKASARNMLRYRLNRTKYDYAKATGQHASATNRAEYGTGEYATAKTRRRTEKRKTAQSGRKSSATKKSGSKKRSASRR